MSERLDRASNRIGPGDRAKLEAALAKRVRQPTQAEVDQILAGTRERLEGLRNIDRQPVYPNVSDEKVREHAGYD